MPGNDVSERERIALVADIDHLDSSSPKEQNHRQLVDAPDAALGIGKLVRPRPHVLDKLLDRRNRQTWVDNEGEGSRVDNADRNEIPDRIVAQLAYCW